MRYEHLRRSAFDGRTENDRIYYTVENTIGKKINKYSNAV
jgi:hypothetical protein